ncbi:MAG: hypothetical protein WD715_17120 [Dongiaceae bacterium]
MPDLTRDMTTYLAQYRTPVFKEKGDHGKGWGSGSFIEVDGAKYILTNEHVATIRHSGKFLGFQLADQNTLFRVQGHHVEQGWPWDLALLPVSDVAWTGVHHASKLIQFDQIALAHTPMPTEVFAFAGFAGERTSFHFDTLFCKATVSLACEVELPKDERWDSRFHFGLDYRPDLVTSVVGNEGLPKPPGLSGSTVWNTCFVEAKARGIKWTPELARVAGVVWGWRSNEGFIIATRAEHIRSFLLGAPAELSAAGVAQDAVQT